MVNPVHRIDGKTVILAVFKPNLTEKKDNLIKTVTKKQSNTVEETGPNGPPRRGGRAERALFGSTVSPL